MSNKLKDLTGSKDRETASLWDALSVLLCGFWLTRCFPCSCSPCSEDAELGRELLERCDRRLAIGSEVPTVLLRGSSDRKGSVGPPSEF